MAYVYMHTRCATETNIDDLIIEDEIETLIYFGECKETDKDLELINVITDYIDSDNNFNFEEEFIIKYFDNYHKYCIFMQKYFKCIPLKIYSIKLLKISYLTCIYENKRS